MPETNDQTKTQAEARRHRAAAFTPRDALFVLCRQRRKALGLGALVLACAAVAAVALPAAYRSEAKMLVRLGRESVALDPTTTLGTTVTPIQSRENEINSELQILKSREIAHRVVSTLGHDALGHAEANKAVTHLQENIELDVEPSTAILTVAYKAGEAQLAQDVVSAYLTAFLELRSQVHRNPTAEAFFADQKLAADAALMAVETQLKDLKDATGVASLTEQRAVLLGRIGELETRLATAHADLAGTTASLAQLQKRVAELPETVVTSSTTGSAMDSLDDLRQKLNDLKLREQDVSARFVEDSPTVQIVRQKIARAEGLLAEASTSVRQETTGLNKTREDLDLRLQTGLAEQAALAARVEAIEQELTTARSRIGTLNAVELSLGQLAREAGIREENLRKYAESFEQARIDQAMFESRISNISEVQAATLPSEPASPNRLLLLVAGLFGAVAGGTLLAFAAEAMDRTLKRPADVEKLGLGRSVSMPLMRATAPAGVTFGRGTGGNKSGGTSGGNGVSRRMRSLHTARRLAVGLTSALAVPAALLARALDAMNAAGRDVAEQLHQAFRRLTWQTDWSTVPPAPWRHVQARRERLAADAPVQQPPTHHATTLHAPDAAVDRAHGGSTATVQPVHETDADKPTTDDLPTNDTAAAAPASGPVLWQAGLEVVQRLLAPQQPACRSVGVVAATAGEGTSTVAARVAAALAHLHAADGLAAGDPRGCQQPSDVDGACLLIDANFMHPSLATARPAAANHAAANHAAANYAAAGPSATALLSHAHYNPAHEVDVLPLAAVAPLITPAILAEVIGSALQHWAVVVVDLPPVNESGLSARLAAACDGTLLVAEANRQRQETCLAAADRLREADANLLGTVLNKRTFPVPAWLYRRA
ncbi:MAG: exopolysaccharide transport family protein [Phycisphaerae bacterium]